MAENKINVGGRLHSIATGNVLVGANEIFDDEKNKKQNDINTETYSLVNNINERLNGLSPDQQSALNVATKATNNEAKLGYYVCDTEGNIAAKVISNATGYVLSLGGSIKVKMTNINTADNATLNINSTGAKPLYYDVERASANNTWKAGETVEVYYDGTSYYANSMANAQAINAAIIKNEEQDQKLSELEQYLYKRYNAKNIRDNSLQDCITGVIKEHLDYFIVEGIPVFGFENIKIAKTVATGDNGIGIVFYNSNDEMLSGYSTMSEINAVVPDSAVYANLTINKSVYNSIKQLLFQPYSNFSSRDLDKRITEISYPKFDINNNQISGEFINPLNGEAMSNASYKRTDYIELFKGQFLFKLNFGLNLAQSTSISFYDENKNFVFSITGPDPSQSYVEQEVDFSEHPNVRYFRATLYGGNLYAFCKKVDSVITFTDAVTTSKIADNAVITSKIANGTIQSTNINSNAFDTTLKTAGKLADAKSVGDTIYDTIIHEIVQNGQLAVLEGNGIERVTETRSGFINKNGNLVENANFQTAIINVANNKAYKIYAPIVGSESVLNRLHLFAERDGNSPIYGSYLIKYDSTFYAVFPPQVKSISVTSSINTTLSVLEYDIANSKTFSFFNSKNEELGQAISDVKQTYGEVTDTTTEYESVEGVVLNGKIQVTSAYPDGFHSKPFWCKRGDVITITQRRNNYALSALYKTDESESFFETLIHGTASQSLVTKECYIQEDGWYGVSGRTNSFFFAKKSISDGYILKATSMDGIKKTIDLTITNNDVVIGDAPVCQFIGSRAYSIKGNGNKTINVSLSETPAGRCFSIGLRIPYATQDVAKVTINDLTYSMASSDARTASGKNYMMEGDHYHRYNFDTRYTEINSFDIVVESEADWEIMLSANCIVDDEMDCCPVMIGYDLTEQYNGYFNYEGESINVYELHKRLNIPYYIAIYKGTVITIQEVQDAIDSGLAEVVFYSGGPAMTPLWNKTDGSFAEKLWQDKCAVGIDVDMNVLSQAVIDRNIYRNLKNAGFKILRHLSQDAGKFSAIADKYGDNDMYISYGYGLGTSSVLPNQLRFPLIMYSHGIGVSNIPDDPYYPSHYVDFDGTRTINTFKYLKSQERIGEVKCLKPSDWFAYIKGN